MKIGSTLAVKTNSFIQILDFNILVFGFGIQGFEFSGLLQSESLDESVLK